MYVTVFNSKGPVIVPLTGQKLLCKVNQRSHADLKGVMSTQSVPNLKCKYRVFTAYQLDYSLLILTSTLYYFDYC